VKIYSYCSYEGSPCGFVLGSMNAKDKDPVLAKDNINPFIGNAFYCGIVDFVFGLIPGQDKWLVMVKNLNAEIEDFNIYLNLAFETSSKEEYRSLLGTILHGYRNIPQLSQRLSNMIIPQEDNAGFGLCIDIGKLNEFLEQCKKENHRIPEECDAYDRLFLYRKILPDAANKNRSKQLMQELRPGFGYVAIHESKYHRHVMAHSYAMARSIKDKIFG